MNEYYKTPLGARKPHAGGWWLKTLTVLDELWVHYAATPDNANAEIAMLGHFAAGLSPKSLSGLHDRDDRAPFANLRTGRGSNKKHGITGATGELSAASVNQGAAPAPVPDAPPVQQRARTVGAGATGKQVGTGTAFSQRVTANDIDAGQVRFPRPAKHLLPRERGYVAVGFRGGQFERARWDPRTSADKERSGLLAFGEGRLDGLVNEGEVLTLTAYAGGRLELN